MRQKPSQPCLERSCRSFDLELSETRRAFTAADLEQFPELPGVPRGVYERRSIGIRSIDYDLTTGTWSNLILSEKVYIELQIVPVLTPGVGVGNL